VYHLGPSFGLALFLLMNVLPPAVAQSDDSDKVLQNVKLIFDTANKICNIGASSTGQITSSSAQTDIRPQLEELSRKLADLKISRTDNLTSEQYLSVLRDQLAASANNNVQCSVEVTRSLLSSLTQRPAAQRTFAVTRESGWRGGGYNSDAWCRDLISILKGEHPHGQFQITGSAERSESRCSPFNCPQYNYTCTVQVTTSDQN
jgi:hypothetical protein